MSPRTALRAGDRVAVPWGLDARRGEVRAVYHTGDVERVLVQLDPGEGGLDEPQTVVLSAEAVTPLSEQPDLPAPGTWLVGLRYEREIAEALARVLDDPQATINMNVQDFDREIDLLIETSGTVIVVETKTSRDLSSRIFDQAIQQLGQVTWQVDETLNALPHAKGLLVTPSTLPASATKRIGRDGLLSPALAAVQWRDHRNDKQLRHAIRALLNDSTGDTRVAEA
jgi:hypothetical protein